MLRTIWSAMAGVPSDHPLLKHIHTFYIPTHSFDTSFACLRTAAPTFAIKRERRNRWCYRYDETLARVANVVVGRRHRHCHVVRLCISTELHILLTPALWRNTTEANIYLYVYDIYVCICLNTVYVALRITSNTRTRHTQRPHVHQQQLVMSIHNLPPATQSQS